MMYIQLLILFLIFVIVIFTNVSGIQVELSIISIIEEIRMWLKVAGIIKLLVRFWIVGLACLLLEDAKHAIRA